MAVGDIHVQQGAYSVETASGRESAPNQRAARARAFELSGGQSVFQYTQRTPGGRITQIAAHPTQTELNALRSASPRAAAGPTASGTGNS